MNRKITLIFLAILTVATTFALIHFNNNKTFNQKKWNNDANSRIHMVDDLVKNYLPGKSKEEVRKLLGTKQLFEVKDDHQNILQYGIDWTFWPTYLVLNFDEQQHYSDYVIYTD